MSSDAKPTGPMTMAELLALPTTVGLETAARALGIGRSTAFGLVAKDEFPVPARRIGKCWRVSTAHLLAYLGVDVFGTLNSTLPE